MGYPPQPQDPYGQQPYGQSGPQYPQQYTPQPYSQPHMPVPHYGPVQFTTVRELGFNPIAAVVHVALWVFVHWWMCLFTLGLWLLVAVPVSFLGWRVTRTIPVQQVHYQQPPYPPQYG
ncbi:hypothetical protein GCM10009850_027720 [Nonomuraea monospora]|uniref:Uncharacterized protein n=1 Tax=Nonomuraea monospora TaxID=568818 RepID=A0ABN3CD51_9ACTN